MKFYMIAKKYMDLMDHKYPPSSNNFLKHSSPFAPPTPPHPHTNRTSKNCKTLLQHDH